jgi:hypothetical protein
VLAQRLEALLRDCRFLVALGLHCQGMTVAEAIRLFESIGFMSELPATREGPHVLELHVGKAPDPRASA